MAKNTPAGALAAQLGTTDIPADVVATFGGLGFLWGHARAKLGKAALWGCTILIGGIVLLSKNGCVFAVLLPQPFECPTLVRCSCADGTQVYHDPLGQDTKRRHGHHYLPIQ